MYHSIKRAMKFNTIIPKRLKFYFDKELEQYEHAFAAGDLSLAWHHLERAHILGQSYPFEHSYVHYRMLLFGMYTKSPKEIIGQLPRLLVGGIKSFVGKIPVGNTGGANVPPLQPMAIPEDLRNILAQNT